MNSREICDFRFEENISNISSRLTIDMTGMLTITKFVIEPISFIGDERSLALIISFNRLLSSF